MDQPRTRQTTAAIRIALASAFGLSFALGVYLLIEAINPSSGLISFTFLLVLPAAVTAFITYVGDPLAGRGSSFYTVSVPFSLFGAVIVASLIFLREGVICILMLAPFWIGLSSFGGYLCWRARDRREPDANTFRASTLLLLPLVAMQIEPLLPIPRAAGKVERTVIIDAAPATVWHYARGVRSIGASDGQWNISQSIIGLPRPIGARLDGAGIGATRHVAWQDGIQFKEMISDWQPGRRLWWNFRFDATDMNAWAMQDRHLLPDSPHYRITDGGYTLERLKDGRTRLTLTTNYWVQTPVNWYARLWGELLVGDVSTNVLAIIRDRSEQRDQRSPSRD